MSTVDRIVEANLQEESYDTSEPQEVNKAKKKAGRTRADRLKFIEAAMSMPQGRAWFYDLLVRCKVFNTPFQEDPYRTAFNCGMSNVGLMCLSDIQDAAPQHYIVMVNENRNY